MCLRIFLPDGSGIQTIRELETTLGLSVRPYHDYPDSLDESKTPDEPAGPGRGEGSILDCCLCHVDVAAYLTDALAT